MNFLRTLVLGFSLALSACLGTPDGITPVTGFDQEKYLGTWYEIARIDNRFERDLTNVTANYTVKDNGAIRVLNRGYNIEKAKWVEANGTAKFVGDTDTAHLKVSFFGPFFASYIVFDLAPDYQHSFVTGNDRDYLWLLARDPQISPELKARFLARITELGFETDELIWVDQALNSKG